MTLFTEVFKGEISFIKLHSMADIITRQ